MKLEEKINKEVTATFDALNEINEVKVNYFFKDKILRKIANQKKESKEIFSWFTPQLQFASLVLVIALNCSVFLYTLSSEDNSSGSTIENFAQEYALQSETSSFFN